MVNEPTLFNYSIISTRHLTQSQQVHDILCKEIQAGRWRIGERMPSMAYLAETTGLCRKTFQTAFDMLKEEGYVETKDRSGTYLRSLFPVVSHPIGIIGVITASSTMISWRLHTILEAALERNYLFEIKELSKEADWQSVDIPSRVFSEKVQGIISLKAFKRYPDFKEPKKRLPVVFFGHPFDECYPLVATDLRRTYYEMTQRVIALGHRRIIFCAVTGDDATNKATRLRIEGYETAMKEAGLPVDRAAIEQSFQIPSNDFKGTRQYLRRWIKGNDPAGGDKTQCATAVIAGSSSRALTMLSIVEMLGIKVPEELSIVTHGAIPIEEESSSRHLSGYAQDKAYKNYIIKMCFDMLTEQIKGDCPRQNMALTMPTFIRGDTLAPPPEIFVNEKESLIGALAK